VLSITASDVVITPARDHHTSFIRQTTLGNYLYVVGGTSAWDTMFSDVQRAKIDDDGSLSAFEKVTDLPEGRAGHSTLVIGDSLFVLGGIFGTSRPRGTTATTFVAKFAPDGSLGAFSKGPDLPKDLMHFTAVARGASVYIFGGRTTTGSDGSTTVCASAEVQPDGTLGVFRSLSPLSPDRSHHASFIAGDFVYIVGGLTGSPLDNPPSRNDIVRAQLLPNGELGPFAPAGALPRGISVSAAEMFGDDLYIFGGLADGVTGGPYTNEVFRARVSRKDGSIGEFTTLDTTLSVKRAHVHQTPVWKNFIYSVGGLGNNGRPVGVVDIGRFE
jgi:hypothetical protein